MLKINDKLTIPNQYIRIRYVRSRGPGGQNVNKLNTKAQLSFDLDKCTLLNNTVRKRLITLAGRRYTNDGNLIIQSDRFRDQKLNQKECLTRLTAMIRKALLQPKKRRSTKPTAASVARRLADKTHRSRTKSLRQKVTDEM